MYAKGGAAGLPCRPREGAAGLPYRPSRCGKASARADASQRADRALGGTAGDVAKASRLSQRDKVVPAAKERAKHSC